MNAALDGVDGIRFRLENARVRLSETKQAHEHDINTLQKTVDDGENVDINEVALRVNLLQVQLDASYRITASTQELSLVNFL